MPYSKEIYQKALNVLEKRRDKAELEAEAKSAKIREQLPEIDSIQRELSIIGLEISKLLSYKEDAENSFEKLKTKSKALVARRTRILNENGYSADELKPKYTCSACEDRGFIDGRMCACHKEILKDLRRLKAAPLRASALITTTISQTKTALFQKTGLQKFLRLRENMPRVSALQARA